MAMFVHLTPASRASRIRKNGISRLRSLPGATRPGVFAVPVTPSFQVSHQWLRELRRRGRESIVGIYFRIPDEEPVRVGRYNKDHRTVTAGEAVAMFLKDSDRQGWEVVIPRGILAREIHRIRTIPQVVGWRFFPEAKGKPPLCTCSYCTRGDWGARRLRNRSR
jgi:hypothetical protein